MTLVEVRTRGSHRQIGRDYGDAAAGEIAEALGFYEEITKGVQVYARRVGPYIDAARNRLPHLVEEMEGLAEGSGRSLEEIAVLNSIEEFEDFEACTTIVSGRFLLHAEQWYGGHHGTAVVMAEPESGPAFVSPTCVGFLPAVGMNARGLAFGVDSISSSDHRVGVPRLLVSRHVLASSSIPEAVVATNLPERAGGYAYVIATRRDASVVESTATASDVLENVQVHTNHCLSEEVAAVAHSASGGSLARFLRAGELLEDRPRSVHDCFQVLSDHVGDPQSICNHADSPTETTTVFGMVADLWAGTVYVSDGPPCEGRWEEFQVPEFDVVEADHVG
jgi:isopenicillin-N N-acyltransferase-like protein